LPTGRTGCTDPEGNTEGKGSSNFDQPLHYGEESTIPREEDGMIVLGSATELRRLVLKKWGSSIVRRSRSTYVRKFSCPDCGCDAFETFGKLPSDDETQWWRVEWRSACGYVFDAFSNDGIDSRFMEVKDEKGAVLGLIDVSDPPPWRRWELGQGFRYAEFSTLWQAWHVGVNECRLITAIQSENRDKARTLSPRTG
jgi:hypothetical protein